MKDWTEKFGIRIELSMYGWMLILVRLLWRLTYLGLQVWIIVHTLRYLGVHV